MKKIEAIVQPFKLEEVKEALKNIGIDGMTISEVRGHGRQKGHKEVYRGQEYNVDLLPKVRFDLVVPDTRLDEVVEALTNAARTGKIGDGKIFVFDVADAIRIRNDDRGDAALCVNWRCSRHSMPLLCIGPCLTGRRKWTALCWPRLRNFWRPDFRLA